MFETISAVIDRYLDTHLDTHLDTRLDKGLDTRLDKGLDTRLDKGQCHARRIRHLVRFLEAANIPIVNDPANAVLHEYGITIGTYTRRTLPTVPDVLLGFIGTDGTWHWPIKPGVAHNLHHGQCIHMPIEIAYPVFLTIGNVKIRRRIMNRKRHIDIFAYTLQTKRDLFWKVSFREFIEMTWHPARVEAWCFDEETRLLEESFL
jgi:hypothetical protein